ncbi:uncharacterized protein LOC123875330 isoform X2 [Maniola jurtina]|uniref:uncharacterized protein LOC123875330 isoform X2 n=1 Tax=Maniola jurtina TaxID=191418 RepID=UPI001E68DFAF|nr:uncharacterized protein LOC123875330 isoform X2 [Maniola jurtina]
MLCRALIAAVVVTYLMCVLLLSGMQKEDLDVSMLTKLKRHNVSIDDMNNEELLQSCIESRNNNSIEKVAQPFISKPKNAALGEYKTSTDLAILKRPRDLENSSYNMSTDYNINHEFHENNKESLKENADENKRNVGQVTEYPDGQAKLESVSKYLQDMRVNKTAIYVPIPQPVSIKEQESKRNITNDLNSAETLNRLIANLSKRSSISTKPTTTQKNLINIEDLYEQLFSLRKQDNMEENHTVNPGSLQTHLAIQKNDRKTSVGKEIVENDSDTKRKELNISNHKNLNDALTLNNTYSSCNPFISDAEVMSKFNGKAKESLKLSRNPFFNKFERVDTMSTNIEPKYNFSRDMIKEIADSVKELILRDLRKELLETTTLISTTTIISTTTRTTKTDSTFKTILNKENIKSQDSVMKKFLELFEEIKTLKRNNFVIPNENKEGTNNKETKQNGNIKEFKEFLQIAMPARIPNEIVQLSFNANQIYGIKQYPLVNSEKTSNFASQIHKYRSDITFKKQEPNRLNKDLLPLTVQTNNIEIPPLGIPLDNSQNLIRENIIITTTVPYRILPNINGGPIKTRNQQNEYIGTPHSEERFFKAYQSKQANPRSSKESYKSPAHQFHPNSKDNIIRFTLNNNDHSKYHADYYEKINIRNYTPSPESDEIKHQDIPRFHEKLEKVERYLDYPEQDMYTDENDCCTEKFRYSQAMIDCCNRKIASRQQMSLNNMKKKSYDDTHFKKFLQSQQKVTVMLEKILGDKRNIQSVETA